MPSTRLDRTSWSKRRLIQFSTNPVNIRSAPDYPIAISVWYLPYGVQWQSIGRCCAFTAGHSSFIAQNLNEDVTFPIQWSRNVGGKVQLKRNVIFKKIALWWRAMPEMVLGLSRATKGVMYTAPIFYTNDYMAKYHTEAAFNWIPGNSPLLPANMLLSLSRSGVGIKSWSQWFVREWQGVFCGEIEELSLETFFFPEELDTLNLSTQNGRRKLIDGSLQREC